MRLLRSFPLLALPGLLLTACTRDLDTVDAPCTGPSASPTGRVLVRYQEQLTAQGPQPTLRCATEKIYPCANYSLQQAVSFADNRASIAFPGVTDPGLCLTSLGPASTLVKLNDAAAGTYAVSWEAAGRRTVGTLLVAADRVELSSCDSNTVAVRYPVTRRIPATTVWGQSYARTPAAQAAVAVVLDSLRRIGAVPVQLPAGHYSYFNVDASGQLMPIPASQNGQPATAVVTPVLLSYSGSFAHVKRILQRKPQGADLSFGLSSARGENAW